MTIEIRTPDSTEGGGWENGDHLDVDEGIATPDGNVIDTTIDDDFVDFGFPATTIVDADTVNGIDIKIRAKRTGSGTLDTITITLVIAGGPKAAVISGVLGDAFATFTFSDATWDDDWTAAELDGAEIRVRSTQTGMPTAATWEIDAIDNETDFTAADGGPATPQGLHGISQGINVQRSTRLGGELEQ